MTELADTLVLIALGCIALAFAAWLTSRGRAALSIPPVPRRTRKFRTSAAATLLLAAVLLSAIAAAMAVGAMAVG